MAKDKTRLTWNGSKQAQREADEAFRKLKASQKPAPPKSKPKGPKKPQQRRFKSYKEYMNSKEWRIKRQEAIRTRSGKCDVSVEQQTIFASHTGITGRYTGNLLRTLMCYAWNATATSTKRSDQ